MVPQINTNIVTNLCEVEKSLEIVYVIVQGLLLSISYGWEPSWLIFVPIAFSVLRSRISIAISVLFRNNDIDDTWKSNQVPWLLSRFCSLFPKSEFKSYSKYFSNHDSISLWSCTLQAEEFWINWIDSSISENKLVVIIPDAVPLFLPDIISEYRKFGFIRVSLLINHTCNNSVALAA